MNNVSIQCACKALSDAIDEYICKANNKLSSKLKNAGFLRAKFSVKQLSELEDILTSSFEKEADRLIGEAAKAKSLKDIDVDELISSAKTEEEIAEIISEHYSSTLPELTDAYIKNADKGLAYIKTTARTSDWVDTWSKQLAEYMKLSQKEKIATLLDEHIKSGKGIDDFVSALQESGIRNERYRARTVAVTETLRAHSVAHNDAMLQNPCVVEKIWRHTGLHNNTARQNHIDMNMQKVEKDKPFSLLGADGIIYAPQFPRDPSLPVGESANCHCIVQDGIDENIIGLPLEERQRMQQEAINELDEEWEKEMDAKHREEHKQENN